MNKFEDKMSEKEINNELYSQAIEQYNETENIMDAKDLVVTTLNVYQDYYEEA